MYYLRGFFQYSPTSDLPAVGWNLLNCNITFHDIDYEYSDDTGMGVGTFTTKAYSDSSPQTRQLLLALASTNMADIAYNIDLFIDGSGIATGSYADSYAIELSREFMAFGASAFIPSQVESIHILKRVVGSRIELIPMVLYLAIIVVFW